MKKVKKETKVVGENVPSLVETKKEEKPAAAKPQRTRKQSKVSVTKIKDLKPISNIKTLKKKPRIRPNKVRPDRERGVCYFSRIPHGFYEKQLEQYCGQFGKVTGVYHPVSKQGNSRGYAFVEFLHKEVAEVVAETMNNYLMFNRLVKCKYIPPEEQRPWVFKRTQNTKDLADLRRKENLKAQMRSLTGEEVEKRKKKRLAKIAAMRKRLVALGVDYEFQVNDTTSAAVN